MFTEADHALLAVKFPELTFTLGSFGVLSARHDEYGVEVHACHHENEPYCVSYISDAWYMGSADTLDGALTDLLAKVLHKEYHNNATDN